MSPPKDVDILIPDTRVLARKVIFTHGLESVVAGIQSVLLVLHGWYSRMSPAEICSLDMVPSSNPNGVMHSAGNNCCLCKMCEAFSENSKIIRRVKGF